MNPFVSAAALAAALALPGMSAIAQQTTTETDSQTTNQAETQQTTTDAQQTDAASAAETFRIISSTDDIEGLQPEEVRIENVEEAPRDQVEAINNSLDPSNPEAMELRDEISGMDAVKQALADESVEEERVVGAAIEEGALVVYVLPES